MTRELLTSALTAFFILLFFFLFTKIFGPIPLALQNTQKNLFTVTGTGEEKAVPTRTTLTIGVTAQASTKDLAKLQMDTVINKVVKDLKNIGIDEKDIKTSGYNIYPNTNQERQPLLSQTNTPVQLPALGSYTGSASVTVDVSTIELANDATDIATKDGANVVSTPSFTFDETQRHTLEEKARKKAIEDAKKKAQELANETGIQLGKVVDIQENSGYPMNYGMTKRAEDNTTAQTTQLNPGENTVNVSVTLSFETL